MLHLEVRLCPQIRVPALLACVQATVFWRQSETRKRELKCVRWAVCHAAQRFEALPASHPPTMLPIGPTETNDVHRIGLGPCGQRSAEHA